MLQVSVTELKNRLSEYLRLVKKGETIEVLEHSIPIARLESTRGYSGGGDRQLEQLVREGVVTRGKRKADRAWLKEPAIPCGGDAVRALIEERGRD